MDLDLFEDLSVKTKTTIIEEQEIEVGNYVCLQTFKNGRKVNQHWKHSRAPHKVGKYSNAKNMAFHYYKDLSILESDKCVNTTSWDTQEFKTSFVANPEKFRAFDNLLCDWSIHDHSIWKINEVYPVPLWRSQSYIGGIRNDDYDLDKVEKLFESIPWVRNVKRITIPYYNQPPDEAVEFEYKLPQEIINDLVDKKRHLSEMWAFYNVLSFDPVGLQSCLRHT